MRVVKIHTPRKIVFGAGSMHEFAKDLMSSGITRIFILTIPPVLHQINHHLDVIRGKGISVEINTAITAEPTLYDFENTLKQVRECKPDYIAGIGGGSVMDLAKILAVFNTFRKPVADFMGIDLLTERKTPLICIPTTSGTGSEVSPNSILLDENEHAKKGIISPFLVPDAAYIDPELTLGLPPDITAFTGLDALTHCIEAYINKYAHPLLDHYALNGISLISRFLPLAYRDGSNLEARSNLALGSLYGGMCLGPVNTGAVHALAYPLGSFYRIAHGLSNAVLLPHIIKYNLPNAPGKYAAMARAMGIDRAAKDYDLAEDGIDHILKLIQSVGIPSHLSSLGIKMEDIPGMAESAMKVQRLLKNNVREVSVQDIIEIYKKSY
jgi:alcohol dehydrogenase class IV